MTQTEYADIICAEIGSPNSQEHREATLRTEVAALTQKLFVLRSEIGLGSDLTAEMLAKSGLI